MKNLKWCLLIPRIYAGLVVQAGVKQSNNLNLVHSMHEETLPVAGIETWGQVY